MGNSVARPSEEEGSSAMRETKRQKKNPPPDDDDDDDEDTAVQELVPANKGGVNSICYDRLCESEQNARADLFEILESLEEVEEERLPFQFAKEEDEAPYVAKYLMKKGGLQEGTKELLKLLDTFPAF